MVKHSNANEVIELCKTIKEDNMFNYMSYEAIAAIFEDFDPIQQKASSHTLWEPYTMPNHFEEVTEELNTDKDELDRKQNKRASEQEIHKYPKQSYANAVGNNTIAKSTHQSKVESTNSQNSNQQTFNTKTTETLNLIQKQLL
jgi:hypothetical protein